MGAGISYSTLVFAGGVATLALMDATDFFNGRFDPMGPYPRNPKREEVSEQYKKTWRAQNYDNVRKPLLVPEVYHQHPFATPDHVN